MRKDDEPDARREASDPSGLPPVRAEAPDTIVLTGFLGRSSRPAYTRLYLESSQRSFVEMPDVEIRHREQAAGEESPAGPKATLWIRRGAHLEYTAVKP